MLDKIKKIEKELKDHVVENLEDLENFRLKYLSKKGVIPGLFADFKNVAPEDKKSVGQFINDLKEKAASRYN